MSTRGLIASLVAVLISIGAGGCNSGSVISSAQKASPQRAQSGEKAACNPDFVLAVSPASATITSGQSVKVTVQLSSLCGLAGTIDVGIHNVSPPPQAGHGFTIYQPRYDIRLNANSTAVAYITLGATPYTTKAAYTVTIQGEDVSGGCCYGTTHSALMALTVK
jgi:hypothetical protein